MGNETQYQTNISQRHERKKKNVHSIEPECTNVKLRGAL